MEAGGCCGWDVVNVDRKKEPSCGLSLCLSLEDYMDFCDDLLRRPDFIIDQLNHIIFMHGFIRMHRRHKAEIMHTLEAMELMQASRSTLEKCISSCASLTLDEVRRDIEAIGWQGCPLGSVQSVGPTHGEDTAAITIASPVSAITVASPVSPISVAARVEQREKKKKKNKAAAAAAAAAADTNGPMTDGSNKKRKRGRPLKLSCPLLTVGPTDEAAFR